MRLLLDIHPLVWALPKPERLDATTRARLEDLENEVLFSAASVWEIAIKANLGHPDFVFDPAQILPAALETGFVELLVRSTAGIRVAGLPAYYHAIRSCILLQRDPKRIGR
jgi:PIN domain nuclease of toxin-antitoxin system